MKKLLLVIVLVVCVQNPVMAQDESFKIVVNNINHQGKYQKMMTDAIALLNDVINSKEFRQKVESYTYDWDHVDNRHNGVLYGQEIFIKLFRETKTAQINLFIKSKGLRLGAYYYGTLGTTKVLSNNTTTYRSWLNLSPRHYRQTVIDYAAHIAHEYCHQKGFYDSNRSPQSEYKDVVPYAVGGVVKALLEEKFLAKEKKDQMKQSPAEIIVIEQTPVTEVETTGSVGQNGRVDAGMAPVEKDTKNEPDAISATMDKSENQQEAAENKTLFTALSWEAGRPERREWSKYTLKIIEALFDSSFSLCKDIKRFRSDYDNLNREQKINVWGELVSAMCKFESDWKLNSWMEEKMGIDKVTGRKVRSEGLLQLSYQDKNTYSWLPCRFDWNADKFLGDYDLDKTIFKYDINLEFGINVLAWQIRKRGKIVLPQGQAYWAILLENGKYERIDDIVKMVQKLKL